MKYRQDQNENNSREFDVARTRGPLRVKDVKERQDIELVREVEELIEKPASPRP